ncbi:PAS domain S-box protein [Paracoccus sp. S-4012]|uniref:ATP-binding protein n=1 Tax=Paracoccus sp. S-4012 TaxID=2665648 RepID=UPI0012AFB425|nr:ATP-binding protein [Paracoccus sp. S-4012]MRX51279.1 PAS domain S-box protein [Paracoccus sp. S-4012]
MRAMPVAVLAADREGRVIGASPAAEALLGERLEGRPFVTVIRHPLVNHALDQVLAGAGTGPRTLRAIISSDGQDHACEIAVSPLDLDRGRGAVIALQDLTAIEQAEQMRRDFVANVSHELRTPLTALMGFIETLRGPAKNDQAAQARFLDIMERETRRMNRLVSDLLSLSRVEGEERRRPSASVDLAGLIRSTVATLGPTAAAKDVQLTSFGAEAPVMVPGDGDQLVQVLHNLIENAVKYGGGEVRVTLRPVAHEPVLRGPGWAVEVADSGPGIDPLHLPRLTERFYRVDTHRSRAQGGTGLGLAIVKHIVNRHRGRLKIESERGKGSRFTVILPASAER